VLLTARRLCCALYISQVGGGKDLVYRSTVVGLEYAYTHDVYPDMCEPNFNLMLAHVSTTTHLLPCHTRMACMSAHAIEC
jgi:hypothetical protein